MVENLTFMKTTTSAPLSFDRSTLFQVAARMSTPNEVRKLSTPGLVTNKDFAELRQAVNQPAGMSGSNRRDNLSATASNFSFDTVRFVFLAHVQRLQTNADELIRPDF